MFWPEKARLPSWLQTMKHLPNFPREPFESLLKPENKGKLADILKYHVVSGRVYSEQVLANKMVKTLQGSNASVAIQDGAPTIQVPRSWPRMSTHPMVSFTSSTASSCRPPRAHKYSASWQMRLPKVLLYSTLVITPHVPPSIATRCTS